MSVTIKIGYQQNEGDVVLQAEKGAGENFAEEAWARQAMFYIHNIMEKADLDCVAVDDSTAYATIHITAEPPYGVYQPIIAGDNLTSENTPKKEDYYGKYSIALSLNLNGAKTRIGGLLEPHIQVIVAANNLLVEAIGSVSPGHDSNVYQD